MANRLGRFACLLLHLRCPLYFLHQLSNCLMILRELCKVRREPCRTLALSPASFSLIRTARYRSLIITWVVLRPPSTILLFRSCLSPAYRESSLATSGAFWPGLANLEARSQTTHPPDLLLSIRPRLVLVSWSGHCQCLPSRLISASLLRCLRQARPENILVELGVNDLGVVMPILYVDPHLESQVSRLFIR